MAGLAEAERPLVPGMQAGEQLMQRHPSVVARLVLPPQAPAFVFPLVRVVEVEPHHIQVFRRASELGARRGPQSMSHASNWLSSYCRAWAAKSGRPRGGNTLMTGIDVDDAGPRVDVPNRLDSGDRAAHQLPFQLVAAPARVRVDEAADVARRPAEERDLIDRRVEGHLVGMIGDHPRDRTAVAREAIDPGSGKHIEPVGPAVVAERPDDLHVSRRPPHAASGRTMRSRMPLPVSSCGQRTPSRTVCDAGALDEAVVRRDLQIVLCSRDEVEPRVGSG